MKPILLVLSLALLASPRPVVADDGVLEIHQACVATGCFPGDAPGFPVQGGSDHSLRLTSDLVVPDATTTAIALGNYGTLDLDGFAIRGPVSCTGSTVAVCPASTGSYYGVLASIGTTIRNGTIRGIGGSGVRSGDGTLVENVTIEENGGDGIMGSNAGGWNVRNSRIVRNGEDGIDLAVQNGHALVTGNVIAGNEADGIQASNALLLDNAISNNGRLGVLVSYAQTPSGHGGNVLVYNNGGNEQAQQSGGVALRPSICATDAVCP